MSHPAIGPDEEDGEDLAAEDAEYARMLEQASDPTTPSDLLDELARSYDQDLRAVVGRNPNVAPDTLAMLIGLGDLAPWSNPALPLILLTEKLDKQIVDGLWKVVATLQKPIAPE